MDSLTGPHTHPAGSAAARAGLHAEWSFVRITVGDRAVAIFCVPTSQGVLLMVELDHGDLRALPTWGADAAEMATSVRAVATRGAGRFESAPHQAVTR